MREDKKLERIELPEIELPGHRGKLRRVLLCQYDQPPVFGLAWPVLPAALALAVLLVLVFNASTFSRPNMALAKEIALQTPEVRALIEEGGIIQDIQIVQGRARLFLIKPITRSSRGVAKTEKIERPTDFLPAENQQFFNKPLKETVALTTFSVEVDFKENRVTSIRKISR